MLVAYDIRDDRRRDRIAVRLQEDGDRIQYSVFIVDGRAAAFVRLRSDLAAIIDPDVDAILFCDLGPRAAVEKRVMSHLGTRRKLTGDDEALIL